MDSEWVDEMGDREFKEWVTRTLQDIRDTARKGLDQAEAVRRAEALEESILAGRTSSRDIELDEELKDVLYALVCRVLPRSEGAERARRATIIGRFLEGVRWDDDLLDERGELIGECAVAAHGSLAPRRPHDSEVRGSYVAEPAEPYIVNTDPTSSSTEDEVRRFFERKQAFLGMVFVGLHGLTQAEAHALESELLIWFLRLCRRDMNWTRQPRSLLFAAACHLARQYRSFEGKEGEALGLDEERIEAVGFAASVLDNADELARERKP